MQMSVNAGFPAALNGLFAAKEVFADHNKVADASRNRRRQAGTLSAPDEELVMGVINAWL